MTRKRSSREWKKKLPPQFLFWMEAMGLEVVLVQPPQIDTFVAKFFKQQMERREQEKNTLPQNSYFNQIFEKQIKQRKMKFVDKTDVTLKYSDHAHNLDELCRRDSLVADIEFQNDDKDYKDSVEKLMQARKQDEINGDSPYNSHVVDETLRCAYEETLMNDATERETIEVHQAYTGGEILELSVNYDRNDEPSIQLEDKQSMGDQSVKSGGMLSVKTIGTETIKSDGGSNFSGNTWSKDVDNSTEVEWTMYAENLKKDHIAQVDMNKFQEETIVATSCAPSAVSQTSRKTPPSRRKPSPRQDVKFPEEESEIGDVADSRGWCELHYDRSVDNLQWDEMDTIAGLETQNSTYNVIPNQDTGTVHSCNQFNLPCNKCDKCGVLRATIVTENYAQTSEIAFATVSTGNSQESLPRDILFVQDTVDDKCLSIKEDTDQTLVPEVDNIYEPSEPIVESNIQPNPPEKQTYQPPPQQNYTEPNENESASKKFSQSSFSDSPTPGVNVTGTISVATSKKTREQDGPTVIEVLAEADEETNDIIDVEINLHCHCIA